MNQTRNTDLLVALTIGGAVGAVLALMFAPAAGSETRQRLRDLGGRTTHRARRVIASAKRIATDQAHRLGRAFEEGRAAYADRAVSSEPRWSGLEHGRSETTPDETGAA